MAKRLCVIVPLVIARDGEGRDLYLYKGASVPDNVSSAEVKRLTDEGFLGHDGEGDENASAEYDPFNYSVPEVNAYLTTADEAEKARVLASEKAGKKRVSIVGSDS